MYDGDFFVPLLNRGAIPVLRKGRRQQAKSSLQSYSNKLDGSLKDVDLYVVNLKARLSRSQIKLETQIRGAHRPNRPA